MHRGTAAGVPYLAMPPGTDRPDAPVVVAWHLMDAPRSEEALAAALPLAGLDAWRIYLGLPLHGSRLPAGGAEELMRLGSADPVLNLHQPVADGAAGEFPAALAELRDRLRLGAGPLGPLGLVGGSIGAAVAQLVIAESGQPVTAAVLVSPVAELAAVVGAGERRWQLSYPWSPAARAAARRLDFVARAGELAAAGQPAVRLVVGADDDVEGFRVPAERLRAALAERYADPARVDLVVVPGMGHALAEEPGVAPAPQTPQAAEVDRLAVDWLARHLS